MPKRSAKNVIGEEPQSLKEALAVCDKLRSFAEGTIHQYRSDDPRDDAGFADGRNKRRDVLDAAHEAAREYVSKVFDPDHYVVCRQLTSEQMSEPLPKSEAC